MTIENQKQYKLPEIGARFQGIVVALAIANLEQNTKRINKLELLIKGD
jgi:hypothetical protein